MNAKQIIENLEQMKSVRTSLDSELEECAAFACPEKSDFSDSSFPYEKGKKKTNIIIDEISEANSILARGLFSNLSPPNTRWFMFEVKNDKLKKDMVVKDFFTTASAEIYSMLMNSNFAMEVNEGFEDIGWAGMINLYVDEDYEKVFKFRNLHISEYFIRENAEGKIDSVYREFPLTSRQAFEKFGNDNLNPKIIADAKSDSAERNSRKYTFIHAVEPNPLVQHDPETNKPLPNQKNRAFKSVYVCRETNSIIRESGYEYMPYNVARFEKKSNSIYGYSPARRVLRSAKLMNAIWHDTLKAGQRIVTPNPIIDINAYKRENTNSAFYTTPGKAHYYDAMGGKPPEFQPQPNGIPFGLELFDRIQRRINAAYFVDMFKMLQMLSEQDKRERTAFEIRQLVSEKQSMIIPVVARLLEEFFTPLLKKCFYIALKKNLFSIDVPFELNGYDIDVSFVSPLALATKGVEVNNFFEIVQSLLPFVEINPGILDYIDFDKATVKIIETAGVHPAFVRSEAEVSKMRKERAQAQQQQMAQQQMMELGKSQDMNKRPEQGSVGELAMGAMGGLANAKQ